MKDEPCGAEEVIHLLGRQVIVDKDSSTKRRFPEGCRWKACISGHEETWLLLLSIIHTVASWWEGIAFTRTMSPVCNHLAEVVKCCYPLTLCLITMLPSHIIYLLKRVPDILLQSPSIQSGKWCDDELISANLFKAICLCCWPDIYSSKQACKQQKKNHLCSISWSNCERNNDSTTPAPNSTLHRCCIQVIATNKIEELSADEYAHSISSSLQ